MRLIISTLLIIGTVFAQTTMDWWIADNGGGIQTYGSGDSIMASIGQKMIGESDSGGVYIGAGYLYITNTTLEIKENSKISKSVEIRTITPNPFNSTCEIDFEVLENCDFSIELFDIDGKKIGNLANKNDAQTGIYRFIWNASDLPSAVYFIRLNARGMTSVKRVVLIK